jgi:tripartite-type tricarboxylate transporter receptor subunit TctC
MKTGIILKVAISAILFSVCFTPIDAPAAPYYEGKVISLLVGHAPGGGYDRMSRLLAKYLPKYIPGKPAIVIRTMLGAGGLVAANYVYQAKPDGLTIGGLTRAIGTSQILKDSTKYAWIGSASSEPAVLVLRAKLGIKTFQELVQSKRKFFIGCSGSGSHSRTIPQLFRDYLGMNVEMVIYPGAVGEIVLAMERNEADGHYAAYSTYLPHIKRGLVVPLCRGRVSTPEIDKLPLDEDLVSDKKAKGIMQIYSAAGLIARPYVAPPGTPENLINILRESFRKAEKDQDLMAEVEKNQMEFNYIPGPQALKAVKDYMNLPKDVLDAFMKYSNI